MAVGQIIAGAECLTTFVWAAGAICAVLDRCLPPVNLPSLAHKGPPLGLPVALGGADDALQVGDGHMVPLLLQARIQPADVGPAALWTCLQTKQTAQRLRWAHAAALRPVCVLAALPATPPWVYMETSYDTLVVCLGNDGLHAGVPVC